MKCVRSLYFSFQFITLGKNDQKFPKMICLTLCFTQGNKRALRDAYYALLSVKNLKFHGKLQCDHATLNAVNRRVIDAFLSVKHVHIFRS